MFVIENNVFILEDLEKPDPVENNMVFCVLMSRNHHGKNEVSGYSGSCLQGI